MLDFNINNRLLPMKGHYFLFNAGSGPVVPFMSVYAKQLGFSSVIVGIVYTILPFSGMLAKPIMGVVADRYKCQKIIFLAGQFLTAIMFLAMIFLPGVPNHAKANFTCNHTEVALDACVGEHDSCTVLRLKNNTHSMISCKSSCWLQPNDWSVVCEHWNSSQYCTTAQRPNTFSFSAHIPMKSIDETGSCIRLVVSNVTLQNGDVRNPFCPNTLISLGCDVECDSSNLNELLNVSAVNDRDVYKLTAFWLLLGVYLLAWLGQAVTVSVSDTICFQLLEDKPIRYGYQRMFGSLGWGIFSITSGILVDVLSKGSITKDYGPGFCIGVALLLLSIVVSTQIQYTQQQLSQSIIKDLAVLLCNLRIFIFVVWCICVGLCTALTWNFLFWLLEELASHHDCAMQSWIKTIEGLVMGIQCLAGELPFFFLSNWILKRLGHIHAMTLVLIVISIRFILYSVITNPWHSLPIELLHGVTFGLFYATMTSYASIVAPPGVETTTQGLVGAIFEGVGVSAGSFIGGIFFQAYGGSTTFRLYGVCALVVALLHLIVQYLMGNDGSVKEYSLKNHDAMSMVSNREVQDLQSG